MNTSFQILQWISVFVLIAKIAGTLSARLGLPLVLGGLLAGVFQGPAIFNVWAFSRFAVPPIAESVSVVAVLKVLVESGVVLLSALMTPPHLRFAFPQNIPTEPSSQMALSTV